LLNGIIYNSQLHNIGILTVIIIVIVKKIMKLNLHQSKSDQRIGYGFGSEYFKSAHSIIEIIKFMFTRN